MSAENKVREFETIYMALKNNFMMYIKGEIEESLFENNEKTLEIRMKGLI